MNYDIIIEKWIDQLNTLFRSIDEFCKKEQDLSPDNSSDIYYKNYCNKLIIGAYLTSPRTIHRAYLYSLICAYLIPANSSFIMIYL